MLSARVDNRYQLSKEVTKQFPPTPDSAVPLFECILRGQESVSNYEDIMLAITEYTGCDSQILSEYAALEMNRRTVATHSLGVCMSPRCSVARQSSILKELETTLQVDSNGISSDRVFILEIRECSGYCERESLIYVDNIAYEDIRPEDIPPFLNSFRLRLI